MTDTIPNPRPLTDAESADFMENGFVILRDVVPADVRQRLQSVFEAQVERLAAQLFDEGLIRATYDDLPFETRFAALRADLPSKFPTSWRKALVSEEVYDLWQRPELLGPARSLVGDEVYAHGVWNGRPREPGAPIQRVLWHQDAHYYRGWDAADGPLISMWTPLVPVDEAAGCLQLLAGSHRAGYLTRVRGFNNLFTVPDEDIDGYDVVSAVMQPGDLLIFGDLTVHQATENTADYVRWSIDIRFAAATAPIISKTPRGYYCFSATDPTRVESFETWEARYNYDDVGLDAEIENFDTTGDLGEAARALGVSRAELEVF